VVGIALLVGSAVFGCASTATVSCPDRCPPDPASDEVALATAIALRYIDSHPFEDEIWDWKSGVLMHGLSELYLVTGEQRLHDYYQSWLDYRIDQGYQIVWSDSCPPAITAVALLSEAPNDDYQRVVDDTLEYLDLIAPRTEEGGISHNGILGNRPSVWLDSLFMFGMVLNRWGELADPDRLDMESEQIQIFADVLQDDNGFMRHAQDWPGYDESVYWARGNSWVVASLADYLRIRVERDQSDPEVEQIFREHVQAIIGSQDEQTGRWLTVMSHPDEPDNYLETSATALFSYGIARAYRYDILGDAERKVALKAIEGVKEMIVDGGDGPVVTGVSTATDPWSLQEYLDVAVEDDVNYGVGVAILALIETSGLPE
jgi:unsaturated rhamnogalacturonyl hydrolase